MIYAEPEMIRKSLLAVIVILSVGVLAMVVVHLRVANQEKDLGGMLFDYELCLRQVVPATRILQGIPGKDEWVNLVRLASSSQELAEGSAYSFHEYALKFSLPPDWQATSEVAYNYLFVKISAPPLNPGFQRLPLLTLVASRTGWASLIPEVITSPPGSLRTIKFFVGEMQYKLVEDAGFLSSRDNAGLQYLLSTLIFACAGE